MLELGLCSLGTEERAELCYPTLILICLKINVVKVDETYKV